METIEQDVTELFRDFGINRRVAIVLNKHMYTVKTDIEDNWLFYTFYGFRELQDRLAGEGKKPKRAAMIGSGNGLDALGVYFAIDGLEKLLITDIDSRVIGLARENVERNLSRDNPKPRIYAVVGNLCKPISHRLVDLVYGNLPNLPSESEEIDEGYNLSSLYRRENGEDTSETAKDYRLEMQELFLRTAAGILNPGGSVLPIIGGRVPYEVFPAMFADAGFKFEEICTGFKRQTEPEIVIPEYANAERDGIVFSFYPYTEAKQHLKKLSITNPATKIDGMELSGALKDYRISAREALSLYNEGINIGHTVHFFRGTLN